MEQIQLLLSKAHAEFRRLRSGELGDNLRAQGIDYKVIWGLESYRMKEIAERMQSEIASVKYQMSDDKCQMSDDKCQMSDVKCQLSTLLWQEDVRESKMLATRLMPLEEMTPELAEEWASQVRYTELADQLCMNLLARLPFAETLVNEWINQREMKQYMALQIALRLDLEKFKSQAEAIASNTDKPMWLRATAQRLSL